VLLAGWLRQCRRVVAAAATLTQQCCSRAPACTHTQAAAAGALLPAAAGHARWQAAPPRSQGAVPQHQGVRGAACHMILPLLQRVAQHSPAPPTASTDTTPARTHLYHQPPPPHTHTRTCTHTQTFVEPSCAFMAQAFVHPPADFAAASEAEGNDVFLCEYEYDEDWKRFRQRRYGGSGGGDDAGGIQAGACPMTPAGEQCVREGVRDASVTSAHEAVGWLTAGCCGHVPHYPATTGLRLTPAKDSRRCGATPRSGGGGSRRLFGGDSSSDDDSDGDDSASDEDRDDTYRPELHWSQRTKGSLPVKRRRQGGLGAGGGGGAAGADKVCVWGGGEGAEPRVREQGFSTSACCCSLLITQHRVATHWNAVPALRCSLRAWVPLTSATTGGSPQTCLPSCMRASAWAPCLRACPAGRRSGGAWGASSRGRSKRVRGAGDEQHSAQLPWIQTAAISLAAALA
jgi:hypothetical protein